MKTPYLKTKDHSISGESFELFQGERQGVLETRPQPQGDKLLEYYESEDYISHTDTKRNLLEHAYHYVRQIALKQKLNLINSFSTSEKKLLDIGCGTGDFLEITKNNNWNITGVEPNVDARNIAISKVGENVFDVAHLNHFSAHSFDVITLWHVLEHLPNLEDHIKLLKHLLKPNGKLVIAVPNYRSYDAQHYKNFWAAYDVPRHLWHFSQEGIKTVFGKVEFEVEDIKPMKFDAYYVSLLSEKYQSDFMNPFKAFWIGWISNYKARRNKEYSSLIYVLKNK